MFPEFVFEMLPPGSSQYHCLFCDYHISENQIYNYNEKMYNAIGMMAEHMKDKHDSIIMSLLNLDKKTNGLSENNTLMSNTK